MDPFKYFETFIDPFLWIFVKASPLRIFDKCVSMFIFFRPKNIVPFFSPLTKKKQLDVLPMQIRSLVIQSQLKRKQNTLSKTKHLSRKQEWSNFWVSSYPFPSAFQGSNLMKSASQEQNCLCVQRSGQGTCRTAFRLLQYRTIKLLSIFVWRNDNARRVDSSARISGEKQKQLIKRCTI